MLSARRWQRGTLVRVRPFEEHPGTPKSQVLSGPQLRKVLGQLRET